MDKAALLAVVLQRNAVRRQANLPPLDVRTELDRAVSVAQQKEWDAFSAAHQDKRDQIEAAVLAELRQQHGPHFPVSTSSQMAVAVLTNQRFEAFAASLGVHKPPVRDAIVYGSGVDL